MSNLNIQKTSILPAKKKTSILQRKNKDRWLRHISVDWDFEKLNRLVWALKSNPTVHFFYLKLLCLSAKRFSFSLYLHLNISNI